MTIFRAPLSRCSSFSTVASGWRMVSSADVLPLDGAPTSACHSTSGSDQADVTWARTPAPQRPATAASNDCAT